MTETTPSKLLIPSPVVERITAHAEGAWPEECCGVLVGRGRRVEDVLEAENVAAGDRTRRYEIAPAALLAAHRRARRKRRAVVGYYHSHPGRPARPSAFDLERAWPDASYLILALDRARVVAMRSWRIHPGGDRFEEESWSSDQAR